jgi:hypothetical protein
MLPLFSKVAAVAAVVLALVAAPAPASAAVVAYRVDFWAYLTWDIVNDGYDGNVTASVKSDLAGVFSTSESAIAIQDHVFLPDTNYNLSFVFTVEGGTDAPFLASPLGAQAPWTTAFNQLLYFYWYNIWARNAAAATDYSAYITNVSRLGSPDLLPKRRYLELTLHGKHLASASAHPAWADWLLADLADAFVISNFPSTHVTLTASASSGVNNSTLSVRFFVKPLLNVAVNRTLLAVFFASNGTAASWLSRCQNLHAYAAGQDLGTGSAYLDTLPESESSLTVTGTAYAPGDESYTDAPTPTNAPGAVTNAPGSVTNAPGDAAPGVTTAAIFIAATALLSAVSLF